MNTLPMNTFGMGPIEMLLLLVGLGGLPSLPLSMPPLPPDPVIERAAPDTCLLHVALAGRAEPVAGSANRAEALLAEAEVQRFIGDVARVAEKLLSARAEQRNAFTPDVRQLAFTLLTRPAALTVDSYSFAPNALNMEGSLVVNCGAHVDEVRRILDAWIAVARNHGVPIGELAIAGHTWSRFEKIPPGVPDIAWGFKGSFFVGAVGTDALEHLLARLADKKRPPPAWKAKLAGRLPLERRGLLAHVDVAKVLEIAKTMIRGPEFAAAAAASGLDGLRAVQAVAGLTKTEIASAAILDFDGPPTGFFAAGKQGVTAADLKAIPAGAAMAQVVKLDLAATFATARAAFETVQPGSSAQVTQMLEQVRAVAGIDVVAHLLEPLGDTWTVYALPDGSASAVVGLDDAPTFAKTHKALLGLLRQAAARPGMLPLELSERQVGDAAGRVTIFTARLPQAPLQPAWCIHGDRLLVATSPERLEQMITRRDDAASLAAAAEVQALRGDRAAALSYQEPKAAVAALVALYGSLTPLAAEGLKAAGTEVPRLPDASLVTKHLLPAVAVLRHDAEGDIVAEGRSSLPLGPFGGAGVATSPTTAGIVVALTLPAVQAARAEARRQLAFFNARRFGLGMLMHESTMRKFPKAAICDKQGKPLLSWRVALLPYIEETGLYQQFHLDEPWDSEHNKKLLELMPATFASPDAAAVRPGMTRYLVPTGPGTLFPRPDVALTLGDIKDGPSKTIILVEVEAKEAVPWTKPEDLSFDPKQPHAGLKNARPTGFLAVFGDGHVSMIPRDIPAAVLAALFTTAGDEQVEAP